MNQTLKIGIIGDLDPHRRSHIATNDALSHAARALAIPLDACWLATQVLDDAGSEITLSQFDALWCAPGSPYRSMDGALDAIRFARERNWPFIGT